MTTKWEKALGKWNEWVDSQKKARVEFERQYGDLAELAKRGKVQVTKDPEFPDFIFVLVREESKVLSSVKRAIKEVATEFVAREIIPANSDLGKLFVDYWLQSAFPELFLETSHHIGKGDITDTDIGKKGYLKLSQTKSKGEMMYILSWYPKHTEPERVADFIQHFLPRDESVDLFTFKPKIGRPKIKNIELEPEAVVCAILNEKARLKHTKIGELFGWECQVDSYEKVTICRTAAKRIKLGKQLLGPKQR